MSNFCSNLLHQLQNNRQVFLALVARSTPRAIGLAHSVSSTAREPGNSRPRMNSPAPAIIETNKLRLSFSAAGSWHPVNRLGPPLRTHAL